MKNCSRCGRAIDDAAIFCSHCGARQGAGFNPFGTENRRDYTAHDPRTRGRGSVWIAILCFLVPLAGLLLWYSWRFTKPEDAASAAKGAVAGVCVGTPVVGLVLWLMWRDTYSDIARVAGISAIVGAALSLVLSVVGVVLQTLGVTIFGYQIAEILELMSSL